MPGNIRPNNNNMWQVDPNEGLNDPAIIPPETGGGGGSANTGTPVDKIVLPPVKWFVSNPLNSNLGDRFTGGYTYDAVAKTITSTNLVSLNSFTNSISGGDIYNAPNAMNEKINGGPTAFANGPQVEDRVLFCDSYYNEYQYIYTITSIGETDVSPWIMTRTNDIDNTSTISYSVAVEETLYYATSAITDISETASTTYSWRLASDASAAFGQSSFATGGSSFAAGGFSEASGNKSLALGYNTYARTDGSVALGQGARVTSGQYSIAIGQSSGVEGDAGSCIVIGHMTTISSDSSDSIVIGINAGSNAQHIPNNRVVIGSETSPANVILNVISISANANITNDDQGSVCLLTNGGITLTMPYNNNWRRGTHMRIINTGLSNCTIRTTGGPTLNGVMNGTQTIAAGQSKVLVCTFQNNNFWLV